MLKRWENGARGGEVKNVIDYNFNIVSKYLPKDIRALSTQERNVLSSDYLGENTVVFDTDEDQWYKYSDGSWMIISFGEGRYIEIDIYVREWVDNTITISFEEHGVISPIVQLYIRDGDCFSSVMGGIKVDSDNNIILSTDLPFEGKVVIR